jgi:hypothetical protein
MTVSSLKNEIKLKKKSNLFMQPRHSVLTKVLQQKANTS